MSQRLNKTMKVCGTCQHYQGSRRLEDNRAVVLCEGNGKCLSNKGYYNCSMNPGSMCPNWSRQYD